MVCVWPPHCVGQRSVSLGGIWDKKKVKKSKSCWGFRKRRHLKIYLSANKRDVVGGVVRGKTRCSVPHEQEMMEEWFVDRGVLSTRFKVPKYGNVC